MNSRENSFPETVDVPSSEKVEGVVYDESFYQFDIDGVYMEAVSAFEDLTAPALFSESAEALLKMLPESITFTDEEAPMAFLLALVEQNYGGTVLQRMSKVENPRFLSDKFFFFQRCIEKGLIEGVKKVFPEIRQSQYLDENIFDLFVFLAEHDASYKEELTEKLLSFFPEEIDVENLEILEVRHMRLLLSLDGDFFEKQVLSRFQNPIDILLIEPDKLILISEIFKKGYGKKLIDFIQPSQKKISLGIHSSQLINLLIEQGYVDTVFPLIQAEPNKKSGNIFSVYSCLVAHGYAQKVIELGILPDSIECDWDSDYFYNFLGLFGSLIKYGHGSEVMKRLVLRDIKKVDIFSENFFMNLVKAGFGEEVKKLIDCEAHFQYLKEHARKLLITISAIDPQMHEKMVQELPEKIELRQISKDVDYFEKWASGTSLDDVFLDWIEGGFAEEVAQKFVGSENFLEDFFYNRYGGDSSQVRFLLALARNGQKERLQELFGEQLNTAEKVIRSPIQPDTLKLKDKVGPHLDEIIKKFPLDPSKPVEKLDSGWFRAQLTKNFGGVAHAYLWLINGEFKVVFKVENVKEQFLNNYRLAYELMPDYVGSASYPELREESSAENKSHLKFVKRGYREVYAGPSLSALNLALLPSEVFQAINWQKKYILLQLSINGIDHGHPHNDNFNVRFLLEKNGEKQLFFDPNVAIKTAIEQQMTLTPIVTLRDWDQATS